jgi:hypothetical protein
MNYNEIKSLVNLGKIGDKNAKEEFIVKFTSLIQITGKLIVTLVTLSGSL